MSTDSRKRCRKSKLVLRDVDGDDETCIKQEYPENESPPKKRKKESKSSPESDSVRSFQINVEVEEFDEEIEKMISDWNCSFKTEPVDDYEPFEIPSYAAKPPENAKLKICVLTKDDIKDAIEKVSLITTSVADKYIEMEARNNFGKYLEHPKLSTTEQRIQKGLQIWTLKANDPPLLYKCYICMHAWWHLADFRDHMNIHEDFRCNVEVHQSEIDFVAYIKQPLRPIELHPESKCWRCGRSSSFHLEFRPTKSHGKKAYRCKGCKMTFLTCTALLKHEGACDSFRAKCSDGPISLIYVCSICTAQFWNVADFQMHLLNAHSVRSDIPVPWSILSCPDCGGVYFNKKLHQCPKKKDVLYCKLCDRRFSSSLYMLFHNKSMRPGNCRVCGISLPIQCKELAHMMIHTNNYKMLYRCNVCKDDVLYAHEKTWKKHKVDMHKCLWKAKVGTWGDQIIVPTRLLEAIKDDPRRANPWVIADALRQGTLHELTKCPIQMDFTQHISIDAVFTLNDPIASWEISKDTNEKTKETENEPSTSKDITDNAEVEMAVKFLTESLDFMENTVDSSCRLIADHVPEPEMTDKQAEKNCTDSNKPDAEYEVPNIYEDIQSKNDVYDNSIETASLSSYEVDISDTDFAVVNSYDNMLNDVEVIENSQESLNIVEIVSISDESENTASSDDILVTTNVKKPEQTPSVVETPCIFSDISRQTVLHHSSDIKSIKSEVEEAEISCISPKTVEEANISNTSILTKVTSSNAYIPVKRKVIEAKKSPKAVETANISNTSIPKEVTNLNDNAPVRVKVEKPDKPCESSQTVKAASVANDLYKPAILSTSNKNIIQATIPNVTNVSRIRTYINKTKKKPDTNETNKPDTDATIPEVKIKVEKSDSYDINDLLTQVTVSDTADIAKSQQDPTNKHIKDISSHNAAISKPQVSTTKHLSDISIDKTAHIAKSLEMSTTRDIRDKSSAIEIANISKSQQAEVTIKVEKSDSNDIDLLTVGDTADISISQQDYTTNHIRDILTGLNAAISKAKEKSTTKHTRDTLSVDETAGTSKSQQNLTTKQIRDRLTRLNAAISNVKERLTTKHTRDTLAVDETARTSKSQQDSTTKQIRDILSAHNAAISKAKGKSTTKHVRSILLANITDKKSQKDTTSKPIRDVLSKDNADISKAKGKSTTKHMNGKLSEDGITVISKSQEDSTTKHIRDLLSGHSVDIAFLKTQIKSSTKHISDTLSVDKKADISKSNNVSILKAKEKSITKHMEAVSADDITEISKSQPPEVTIKVAKSDDGHSNDINDLPTVDDTADISKSQEDSTKKHIRDVLSPHNASISKSEEKSTTKHMRDISTDKITEISESQPPEVTIKVEKSDDDHSNDVYDLLTVDDTADISKSREDSTTKHITDTLSVDKKADIEDTLLVDETAAISKSEEKSTTKQTSDKSVHESANTSKAQENSTATFGESLIKMEGVDTEIVDDKSAIKLLTNLFEEANTSDKKKDENATLKELKLEMDDDADDLFILSPVNEVMILDSDTDSDSNGVSIAQLKKKVRQKGKIYKCSRCNFRGLYRAYHEHVKEYQHRKKRVFTISEEKIYTCTKCNKTFFSSSKYVKHFSEHGLDPLTCPQCNETCDTHIALFHHLNRHVRKDIVNLRIIDQDSVTAKCKPMYQCMLCSEKLMTNRLFEHWEDKHLNLTVRVVNEVKKEDNSPDAIKSLLAALLWEPKSRKKTCVTCERVFTRQNECKRHMIEHLLHDAYQNRITYQALRCQKCGRLCHKAEEYKSHMRVHGGLPIYKCGHCNKTFSDSSNFCKHKKVHNLSVLVCDMCNKKFHIKASLEKHMQIHIATPPINCANCSRVFYDDTSYRRHRRLNHERGKQRFRCIICKKSFDSLRLKWDHMWLVHKERKDKADCPFCSSSFRKFSDVKIHIRQVHNCHVKIPKKSFNRLQAIVKGTGDESVVNAYDDLIDEEDNNMETLVIYE